MILLFSLFFLGCKNQKRINVNDDSKPLLESDTLVSFSIELVKKLDNKIEWSRIEFDSITSQKVRIHRPVFNLCEKNDFVESVEDIDLFRYFTKEELNHLKVHPLDSTVIKKYGSVNADKIRDWHVESERLLLENPKTVIPPSFQWYFSISGPVLSKNGKHIYLEIFESNINKSAFWVYIFEKEKNTWKIFHVKEITVKM